MKRLSASVVRQNEDLVFKKNKLSDVISEIFVDLERIEEGNDDDRFFSENLVMNSSQVDHSGGLFGNIVPCNFEGPSRGDVEEANQWDFDINFDLIFGNEDEHAAFHFDDNSPLIGTEDNRMDKGIMINENRVEIIDIESDDSDDDVEIIGFNIGYEPKGKTIEKLSLGFNIDNVGESSIVGETRYTREEKGKANIVDPWPINKPDYPIDLDFWQEMEFLLGSVQPASLSAMPELDNPAPLPARPELAIPAPLLARPELAEEELIRRMNVVRRENLRETAKRFARISDPNGNVEIESISQKELGSFLGPFSDSLRRVRERTKKTTAEKLIHWKPLIETQSRDITSPLIPSLLDKSLKALAENAKGIVSLELVPSFLCRRLADVLCDIGKMDAHILNLIVKGSPDEIRIKNCSWLTEEQFQKILGSCLTNNLRVLQLDLCGQVVFDYVFRDTLTRSPNSLSSLAIVSLRGASRLSDNGLKELLNSAPALQSMNLGQSTLLTSDAIHFIADSLGSNLRELYIDDCQKINAMVTLPAMKKFMFLEVLSVAGILSVTDQFISEMVSVCGESIKELDLANCIELTDLSLKTIGSSCTGLCSLNISSLRNLTDQGIEFLANGCRSIQKLKLSHNGFSDEATAAFLETSGESLVELLLNNVTKVGANTALSLANHSRKLLYLDISWCRQINNDALGLIVDNCSSMKLLKIFGCRQITSVFLNGHSNSVLRIIGLNLTPLLNHVNLLESDEVFLRYSPLPVCTESLKF